MPINGTLNFERIGGIQLKKYLDDQNNTTSSNITYYGTLRNRKMFGNSSNKAINVLFVLLTLVPIAVYYFVPIIYKVLLAKPTFTVNR